MVKSSSEAGVSSVRDQYEKFPYPPIPWFAIPQRTSELKRLSYGFADPSLSSKGIRILVVGAGTFEPLVVALANSDAGEIVAVDVSSVSLKRMKWRWALAKILSALRLLPRLPRLRIVTSDLMALNSEMTGGCFDFVVASNVLHHLQDPAGGLARLSGLLKVNGWFRLVTYPKMSRYWMRETSRWLKEQGLTPQTEGLVKKAHSKILELPVDSAIRGTFLAQAETQTLSGLVDAFFNACENPLHPMEWAMACQAAGLRLFKEDQREDSQSSFLLHVFPEATDLHPWMRLQVLDDLLEICSNPVLWLWKTATQAEGLHDNFFEEHKGGELVSALKRVALILAYCGFAPAQIQSRLLEKLEPKTVPGISIIDGEGRAVLERWVIQDEVASIV